jgi:DNA-binding PadR family transcriptional regulator
MTMKPESPDPGSKSPPSPAAFHILLALSEEDLHGYRIMQKIEEDHGGQFRIGPGTLYRTIKQLLAGGLIEESGERPDPALDDERRRYYRLTLAGRKALAAEASRLEKLVRLARSRQLPASSQTGADQ